ncbi:phosphoserine phosphatase SerB [Floricoccus penangensis]|uniref:phosphoserine phosphatase n=1 Tax=Floricoccus penangensis TaxID=1859475 RepID=A0A9Q5NZH6_9LACT|nr:phosphoserine phosphatase SerB [Floricoccus penangensis]OFI46383.1 phosphoserine phosphatase SerB [Floricoccus penangensis]
MKNKVTGLLVMDVDSTLIQEEVIDLLGEEAGIGEQVAQITEKAMRGEIDFEGALRERVSLLNGLPTTVFDKVLARVHFTPGAEKLIHDLKEKGFKIGVVSGGFHEIVDILAEQVGLDYVQANRLEVENGILTGQVVGEIVTKDVKKNNLLKWAKENGLGIENTVAMGDGANDLPMIEAAGVGIAFNAKPIVREQASYQINEPDLYKAMDIIEDKM